MCRQIRYVFGGCCELNEFYGGVGEAMSDAMRKKCEAGLAEYRAATVRQLAFLMGVHPRTVSYQLQEMRNEGIVASQRYHATKRGRPAEVFRLKQQKVIRQLAHHMLVMSFRLHLMEMLRELPEFSARHWHPGGVDCGGTEVDAISKMRGYEPDGAYSLGHRGKRLLLFLEADTGKESLEVIRGKVTNYIGGFRQKLAESWGRTWEAEFRGFRVLFVANNEKRLNGIVDVVREAEVDFIWTTTVHRLVEHGLAGRIWSRSRDNDRHSLLGSLAPVDQWGHEKDAMRKACHIVRSTDHA